MTDTPQDLIKRLEAATGEDRELDAEIARFIGARHRLPNYTGSVDDAMGLVPEGTRWDISGPHGDSVKADADSYTARLCPLYIYDKRHTEGYAPTPALAMTIAAMKALDRTPALTKLQRLGQEIEG